MTEATDRRPKILYVEDNEDNAVLVKTWLEARSFEVVLAADGEQGIAAAKKEKPDLILMDMAMPVLDGWKATAALKTDSSTQHIPIIGISAHAMLGDREKALKIGCDDYLTKPVKLAELMRSIRTAGLVGPRSTESSILVASAVHFGMSGVRPAVQRQDVRWRW